MQALGTGFDGQNLYKKVRHFDVSLYNQCWGGKHVDPWGLLAYLLSCWQAPGQ